MTDPSKPANPLMVRRQEGALVKAGASLEMLQQHCDMLNAMAWVRASGKPFLIRLNADAGRHELVRQGEVSDRNAA